MIRNAKDVGRANYAGYAGCGIRFRSAFSIGARFPTSLLHRIFIYAADPGSQPFQWKSMQTALNLACVCRVAAEWMRPIIWRSVYLTNSLQATNVHRSLLASKHGLRTSFYVRNLWICKKYISSFTSQEPLRATDKNVAQAVAADGNLQNLAIDMTLLTEGWLAHSVARPRQVLLLDNENQNRPIRFNQGLKLFDETTHLIVGSHWLKVAPLLPAHNPLLPFKALQALCVRVPAGMDTATTLEVTQHLEKLRGLAQLVVCIEAPFSKTVSVSDSVWQELKKLEQHQTNLVVLSRALPVTTEWQAIVHGKRTIWARVLDPIERNPGPPMQVRKQKQQGPKRVTRTVTRVDLEGRLFSSTERVEEGTEDQITAKALEMDFTEGLQRRMNIHSRYKGEDWFEVWK